MAHKYQAHLSGQLVGTHKPGQLLLAVLKTHQKWADDHKLYWTQYGCKIAIKDLMEQSRKVPVDSRKAIHRSLTWATLSFSLSSDRMDILRTLSDEALARWDYSTMMKEVCHG